MRRYLAAVVLVVTTGCSTVTTGTVVDKGYDPPYDITTFICSSYSPQGICTVQVPLITTYPECWRLELVNAGQHGSICIPKAQWDYIRKGDRWDDKSKGTTWAKS